MLRKILLVGLFAGFATAAVAAPKTFDLSITDGGLRGPGAEILHNELRNAQFILYGEDHGFADSAIVLRALAHDARPLGFRYHVVEVGPRSITMISEALSRDGVAGISRLLKDDPLGIPFLGLKDDAKLASDFLGTDAKGTPYLWGVDQEFIGAPLFHLKRLVVIAPNEAARSEVQHLLAAETDALANAAQDKFLLMAATPEQFDALAKLFAGVAEAEAIIGELKESAAIYQAWMSGHNYENNAHRARLLAANFLRQYRVAADPMPKVVFKMGLEHVALGTTTVNTVDLGTLASEMARLNDKTALRIAFLPMGGKNLAFASKPGNPTTIEAYDAKETADFFTAIGLDAAALPKDRWTLVPLEPVRQALDTQGLDKLSPNARFILLGYNYLITTPDAKPGEFLLPP